LKRIIGATDGKIISAVSFFIKELKMAQYSFSKNEHLVSRTDIEALFVHKSGVITEFPLRLVYREVPDTADDVPVKVLISVSKRHFKLAVDRNRAKRQIREAYRLNKEILWDELVSKRKKVHIAFLWLSDNPVKSEQIVSCIRVLLNSLRKKT